MNSVYTAASYTGFLQTAGLGDTASATNTGTPNPITTVDLTETNEGLIVLAGTVIQSETTSTVHADLTEQIDVQPVANVTAALADRLSTTDGNVSCELTWASSGEQCVVTAEFLPAAGGGGGSIVPIVHQLMHI